MTAAIVIKYYLPLFSLVYIKFVFLLIPGASPLLYPQFMSSLMIGEKGRDTLEIAILYSTGE